MQLKFVVPSGKKIKTLLKNLQLVLTKKKN
jgi:hypothetical protein